jgi:hypothetical protein
MSTFAHDFAQEIQVGFYELGFKTNTWILQEANNLMFGERKKSSSTRKKDHYVDMFTKMLDNCGNKLFYISKQEDNKVNMIAMVIFAVLKKGDKTEGSYILQLKTTDDHYDGLNENHVQKFRGKGLRKFLIELVKCYTYGISTKLKSDVVLKISNNRNDIFLNILVFKRLEVVINGLV